MRFLAYADGSHSRGTGHLFRLTRITKVINKQKDFLFIHTNNFQKSFYHNLGLPSLSLNALKKLSKSKFNLCIIDSKNNESILLDEFKKLSSEIICFDCISCWAGKAHKLIIPSFFINSKDLNKNCLSKTSILHGKKYVPIESNFKKYPNSIHTLISFGGSDPNNITSKILALFPDDLQSKKIYVVLGPGFKNVNQIQEKFKWPPYIKDKNSIINLIDSTERVITALGTTIQECEYLGKPTGLVFNYQEDLKDIKFIKQHSSNEDFWHSFGHHSNIKKKLLDSFLRTDFKSNSKKNFNHEVWGSELKNIFK